MKENDRCTAVLIGESIKEGRLNIYKHTFFSNLVFEIFIISQNLNTFGL